MVSARVNINNEQLINLLLDTTWVIFEFVGKSIFINSRNIKNIYEKGFVGTNKPFSWTSFGKQIDQFTNN